MSLRRLLCVKYSPYLENNWAHYASSDIWRTTLPGSPYTQALATLVLIIQ